MLSKDQQLNARLEQEIAALKRAGQGLRSAVYDLRLEESAQRSVVSSVEDLVDLNRTMGQGRYEVELVVEEGFPRTLSGRFGTELVRIIWEALNNARRHSQAKNVRVVLGVEGNDCWAEVVDDGQGFEPRSSRRGVGMSSMQERAEALGGEVEVESEPGKGTRVLVRLPCRHDQEE
jgi:signal transduction histidine kinase